MRIILSLLNFKGGKKMLNLSKKIAIQILLILMIVLVLSGCTTTSSTKSKKVIASFYPLQFILSELTGKPENIVNITPIGAEPHDLELSPDAVEEIQDAKLVVAMGDGFQPSVEKSVKSNKNSILLLDELFPDKQTDDPHFWLDPVLMQKATTIISNKLQKVFPEDKVKIVKNENILNSKLEELNIEYSNTFAKCKTQTIITSHDAFSYMTKRYGLIQESIAGFSPENEPSPERLSELSDLANKSNAKVIFTEDLVSDKLAKALASEIGAKTETLNAIEFLNEDEKSNASDYFTLMRTNKNKIAIALDCENS